MILEYYWQRKPSPAAIGPDALLQYLLEKPSGIVLLDGHSGCGKTTLLKKLKETASRPVYLFSCERVVDEILCAARKNEACERYLLDISENNCVIGIEDIDYLRGKEATQACLAETVCNAAEKHLVITTGNNVASKTPVLYKAAEADIFQSINNVDKTMVVLMGIQGSGKSTFYQTYLSDRYVRVNLDTLKTRHQENLLISDCLLNGKSFAVDNTNPTKADRKRYIPAARCAGYKVIGYFMEFKLKTCIERNDQREGAARIPATAIAATSNKLQLPSYDEGFDELYFVKNDGQTMTIENWRV